MQVVRAPPSGSLSNPPPKPWSNRLLFLLAAIVIFAVWVLVIHTMSLPAHPQGQKTISINSDGAVGRMEELLHSTQALVREVIGTNLTFSPSLRAELTKITSFSSVDEVARLRAAAEKCSHDLQALQAAGALTSSTSTSSNPNAPSSPGALSAPCTHQSTTQSPPPPPLASIQPITGHPQRWLVIGIPTVARQHDEEYLLRTLDSFASQLSADKADLFFGNVLVHVINFQVNYHARRHVVFEKARTLYNSPTHPLAGHFLFTELTHEEVLTDPVQGATLRNDPGTPNKPGYLVRRQTRNIATTIYKSMGLGKYYLFLEDDMELCAHGLLATQYLLQKASVYHPNWLAIRASYGMNGIFMHNTDLHAFLVYLLDNQRRRPPDHLVVEYYAGETAKAKQIKGDRANIGFKYNLFNHLGEVSTLRSARMTGFPRCYEVLAEPTVFKVEAYSPKECPKDDLWPCKRPGGGQPLLVDWGKLAAPIPRG